MNYISKGLELVTYLGGEIGEKIESNEIDIDPWNGRLEIKDLDKFHRIYQKLKPHEIDSERVFLEYKIKTPYKGGQEWAIRLPAGLKEIFIKKYGKKYGLKITK